MTRAVAVDVLLRCLARLARRLVMGISGEAEAHTRASVRPSPSRWHEKPPCVFASAVVVGIEKASRRKKHNPQAGHLGEGYKKLNLTEASLVYSSSFSARLAECLRSALIRHVQHFDGLPPGFVGSAVIFGGLVL